MRVIGEVRYKPPGVYPSSKEPRAGALALSDVHIAGFVGIAQKGPLNQPVRIGSWNDFVEAYGAQSEGYLARCVEGYFQNGGKVCYVVRVARLPKAGQPRGPEHAAQAVYPLKDEWDKPTLLVSAQTEGRWGNNVWVSCKHTKGADTFLTLDLAVGSGQAVVKDTRGLERGALVRIYDRANSDYVILTKVSGNTIYWDTDTPVLRNYSATSPPTSVEVLEFEIHAALRDRREVFRNLQISPRSRHYAPRVVNERSTLIRLQDLGLEDPGKASQLPHNLPAPAPPAKLAGGRDGTEGLTVEDFVGYDHGPDARTGLHALEHEDEVGLLLCPDAMLFCDRMASAAQAQAYVHRVQQAMVEICERTQDRFAVLDVPNLRDVRQVIDFRFGQTSQVARSSYAAYYFPWLVTEGVNGGAGVAVPPSGHVAGVYARCDLRDGVHRAPANEVLTGVTQLTLPLSEDHVGQLNEDGVNTVRAFVHPAHPALAGDKPTGRGIRIWGARTASPDAAWRYLNVRRLFIMLRRALQTGTTWVCFEPNVPSTWGTLAYQVSLFLRGLYERGYFAGGAPEESFIVKCDGETNTPEDIDVGRLRIDVLVAPARPAEYILLSVEQESVAQGEPGA